MAATVGRKEREVLERRTAILLAAGQLFAQKGYAETTMAEIARTAQVAVGTIYQLFANKDELIEAVAEERAAWLLGHSDRAGGDPGAPAHGLQKQAGADLLRSSQVGAWALAAPRDRREREVEAKRHDILSAASTIFQQKGLHGATMADIAAVAGVATGTLYKFFASKEALYFGLIEERADEFFLHLRLAVNRSAAAADQIRELVRAECAFYAANRAFLRIYISTRSGFESLAKEEMGERFHQKYAGYLEWVTEIIRVGIERHELRDLNAQDMAVALVGMLNAALFEWTVADITTNDAGTSRDFEQELLDRSERVTQLFLGGAALR